MPFQQPLLRLVAMALLLKPSFCGLWRVTCAGVAGIGLIDPIVSPGKTATHMHTIKGASGESASESLLVARNRG